MWGKLCDLSVMLDKHDLIRQKFTAAFADWESYPQKI